MTHSYLHNYLHDCMTHWDLLDSSISTWLIHIYLTHSYLSVAASARLIYICICVTQLIHICDMTHPCVQHNSYTRATWLILGVSKVEWRCSCCKQKQFQKQRTVTLKVCSATPHMRFLKTIFPSDDLESNVRWFMSEHIYIYIYIYICICTYIQKYIHTRWKRVSRHHTCASSRLFFLSDDLESNFRWYMSEYIYIYTYKYIYIYIYMYIYTDIYTHTLKVCIATPHMRFLKTIFPSDDLESNVRWYMSEHIYIYIHIYTYIYIYLYMYICTDIYTHTLKVCTYIQMYIWGGYH